MTEKVEIIKFIELPFGMVELRSDNILAFRPEIGIFKEYNIEILKVLLNAFVEITDGIPRPYLCDNRYITGIVNREEQAYINKYFDQFATKSAMITQSSVVKIIVNSYNSIFKPKIEMRLFSSEESATKWLLSS
ncbi:MAG: hypothetical protein ACI9N1_002660 [Flavobacteriales bacterium]|jgi:hypothetical protein